MVRTHSDIHLEADDKIEARVTQHDTFVTIAIVAAGSTTTYFFRSMEQAEQLIKSLSSVAV